MPDRIRSYTMDQDCPPGFRKAVRLLRRKIGGTGEECVFIFRQLDETRFMVECRNSAPEEGRAGAAYLAVGEEALLLAWNCLGFLDVQLLGEICGAAVTNLVDLLVDGLAQGYTRFVLDLGKVSWIGSGAHGALEGLVRGQRRAGKPLRLELRRAERWPFLLGTHCQDGSGVSSPTLYGEGSQA